MKSTTHTGRWKPNSRFEICVLVAKARSVRVSGDSIQGETGKVEQKSLPKLLTEFLNWPGDKESILRFTKMYGPLVHTWDGQAIRDAFKNRASVRWSFDVQTWGIHQATLRDKWEKLSRLELRGGVRVEASGGDEIHIEGDRVILELPTLLKFLQLFLALLPLERLKKCRRPREEGCDTPYFVATHMHQEYCSDVCAHWAQKAAKREWWKRRNERIKKAQKGKKK